MSTGAFWREVFGILDQLQNGNMLPEETLRFLDDTVVVEPKEGRPELTPLQYVEGLLGTLPEEDPLVRSCT